MPPGNHVLVFTMRVTAVLAGGPYAFTSKSIASFTVKPDQEAQVVIVIGLNDNPATRVATQIPTIDLQFEPPSAAP